MLSSQQELNELENASNKQANPNFRGLKDKCLDDYASGFACVIETAQSLNLIDLEVAYQNAVFCGNKNAALDANKALRKVWQSNGIYRSQCSLLIKMLNADVKAYKNPEAAAEKANEKATVEHRISPRPADKPVPPPAFLEVYLETLTKPDLYTSRIDSKKVAPVAPTYIPDPAAKHVLAKLCADDVELSPAITTYKSIYNPIPTPLMRCVEKNIGKRLENLNIPPTLAQNLIDEIKAGAAHLERQSRFSSRTH